MPLPRRQSGLHARRRYVPSVAPEPLLEPFDPTEASIEEVRLYLLEEDGSLRVDVDELQRVRALEQEGKNRATLLKLLDAYEARALEEQDEDDEQDGSEESTENQPEG